MYKVGDIVTYKDWKDNKIKSFRIYNVLDGKTRQYLAGANMFTGEKRYLMLDLIVQHFAL